MREWNSIDRITGFEVMKRSIYMSPSMGIQVNTGDEIVPVILLSEYRWNITRIYEDAFR